MRRMKLFIAGALVGLVIGLWFGINIGKDNPLFSNPFKDRTIQQKLKESGGEVLEKSGKALEESGKALKDRLEN